MRVRLVTFFTNKPITVPIDKQDNKSKTKPIIKNKILEFSITIFF